MHRSAAVPDTRSATLSRRQKGVLAAFFISVNFLYFISSAYITTSNDGSHFALTAALVLGFKETASPVTILLAAAAIGALKPPKQ